MNDRSRMMLYALTAVACVVWIWQSVQESMTDGTMISTSNIIFLVCIGIAAVYCAANALILWWRQPGKNDEEDGQEPYEEDEQEPSETADDEDDESSTTAEVEDDAKNGGKAKSTDDAKAPAD